MPEKTFVFTLIDEIGVKINPSYLIREANEQDITELKNSFVFFDPNYLVFLYEHEEDNIQSTIFCPESFLDKLLSSLNQQKLQCFVGKEFN